MNDANIIAATQGWIKEVVIGLNFCPFANLPFIKNNIRYAVAAKMPMHQLDKLLLKEIDVLKNDATITTTLLILPNHFISFAAFLQYIQRAERLLTKNKLNNHFQLAHFHPNYVFENTEADNAANYTNRSPYPILHILRQESIAEARKVHAQVHQIPNANVALAQKKGVDYFKTLLENIHLAHPRDINV